MFCRALRSLCHDTHAEFDSTLRLPTAQTPKRICNRILRFLLALSAFSSLLCDFRFRSSVLPVSNNLSISKVPKFTLFKFVILFQSFMPFSNPLVLSIIYQLLLPRHYILITHCSCYFTPTSIFLCHFCYSHSTCLLPCHFLISTPFNHFHFPSTFFTLCLLTTQIKSLPPSHKLSSLLPQI